MSPLSRRTLLGTGLAAAGLGVVAGAGSLLSRFGLMPPDGRGWFGPGESLTYAAQRLLTSRSRAREFPRELISAKPFANEVAPPSEGFQRLAADGFAGWKLSVDGLVARPALFSLAAVRALPVSRQVTEVACEEGWSYIAEWIGTPLARVLDLVGVLPHARYVIYRSIDTTWWDSIDMADALHPQTILAWGMNGGDLPVPFGGPLRMRVPRQLGYKSVKYITGLTVTDSLATVGKGLGSSNADDGYAWYAGI